MNIPKLIFKKETVLPGDSANHSAQQLPGHILTLEFNLAVTLENTDTVDHDVTNVEILEKFEFTLKTDNDYPIMNKLPGNLLALHEGLNVQIQDGNATNTVPAGGTKAVDLTVSYSFVDKRKSPFIKDFVLSGNEIDYINVTASESTFATGTDIKQFDLTVYGTFDRMPGFMGVLRQVRFLNMTNQGAYKIPARPGHGVASVFVVNANSDNTWTLNLNGDAIYTGISETELSRAFQSQFSLDTIDNSNAPLLSAVGAIPLFGSPRYRSNDIFNGEIYLERDGTYTGETILLVEYVKRVDEKDVSERTGVSPALVREAFLKQNVISKLAANPVKSPAQTAQLAQGALDRNMLATAWMHNYVPVHATNPAIPGVSKLFRFGG